MAYLLSLEMYEGTLSGGKKNEESRVRKTKWIVFDGAFLFLVALSHRKASTSFASKSTCVHYCLLDLLTVAWHSIVVAELENSYKFKDSRCADK